MYVIDQNSLKSASKELAGRTCDVLLTDSLFAEMIKSKNFVKHFKDKMQVFLDRPESSYLTYSIQEIILTEREKRSAIRDVISAQGTKQLRSMLLIVEHFGQLGLAKSAEKIRADLNETYFKEDAKNLYQKVISIIDGSLDDDVATYKNTKIISDRALLYMAIFINTFDMKRKLRDGWTYDQVAAYVQNSGFFLRSHYLHYICGFMYLGDCGFENMKESKVVNQNIDNNVIVKASYGHKVITEDNGMLARIEALDRMIKFGKEHIPTPSQLKSIATH